MQTSTIPSDCDLCDHARYFFMREELKGNLMDVCLKLRSFASNRDIAGESDSIPAICHYYKRRRYTTKLISTPEALSALPKARRTKLSILIIKERM